MSIYTRTGHIGDNTLTIQVLEDLRRRRVDRVKQHLAACVHCRRQAKEAGSFVSALRLLAGLSRRSNGAS